MDGSIFKWAFNENNEPTYILNLEHTITSIKPKKLNNMDTKYLITDTQGEVNIFSNL